MQQPRKRRPSRLALLGVLVVLCTAFGSTVALASDCAELGGTLFAGECQISTAVTASDAAHGGPFVLDETLHITGSGSITVPPAAGASLTLKITGDLIMDVPTVANRSRIVGDVTTATGVGATITVEASRNIVLNGNGTTGARISSNQTAGSCAGGGGGDITLRATATIITDKGSSITSTSLCPAGEIILDAGLGANIAGLVLSDGTSTIGRGGPITIASACTLTIADSGQVISRGKDPGADLVHLEGGCSVTIHGLVASTGHGHVYSPPNRCHGAERPDKPNDAAACVEIWSGGTLTIDRATHTAEVHADSSIAGGVQCCAWINLIASGDVKILGSTANPIFAVHANQILTNGYGGHITAISTTGKVTASGRAIQANAPGAGGHAGAVSIEAKQDVTLNDALILAQGDYVPTYGSGGTIEVRSYGGGLSWTNPTGGLVATGDVQPTGAGVASAIRGVVDLKSCGPITTTGTLFPVTNGAATSPVLTAGLCPPAEAAAPVLQPYVSLPPCICASPRTDVSVTKTTSTPSVSVGGTVVYTITVMADGSGESTGVKLTDALPTGSTWTVSGPDAPACTPASPVAAGATLTCNFGTMAPGENRSITLTGKAAAANCPTMANTAVVNSENDSDPSNNTSGPIPISVSCNPDVAVVKTTTTPKITAGGAAKYSITVTAGGTGSSTNVKLTDAVPAGFTWALTGDTATCTPASPVAGGTTLTCSFGTMAQGTSKTIHLSATTTASQCVTISNTAAVTSSNDSNSVNNTSGPVSITVECKPDVSVSKKTSDATIAPGEKAQYTITVTAGGTGGSTNVVLTDVLSGGFTWTVGGADASFCSPASPVAGGSTLTCNFGAMSQGSTRTVKLEATVTADSCAATISNTATVTADVDAVSTNNVSGPVKIEVKCPDVKVVKTTSTPTVSVGGTAKYTIAVTAAGSVPATGVVLTDVLPSGVSWTVGGSDASKCSPASPVTGGTTLTCQLGDMSPGSTRSITLSATTTKSNCPFIYNTATVSATLDSVSTNNTSGPVVIALNGCSGVVRGKTKGFWGNDNGHAVIDPDKNGTVNNPVTIGGGTRGFTVTTVAQSDKILRNDACTSGSPTIFSPCTFSTGLQENTLDNLASQTLALTYNIAKINSYSGQTMATLGCTASVSSALSALGLSGTSTVNQVLTVANTLINNSKSGGTTTQTQAGDMNGLLGGCVNQE